MTAGWEARLTPESWEVHSDWWVETFTDGADPEYDMQIMPLVSEHVGACRTILDLGCGEGQVCRHLAAEGRLVAGLDPSPSQMGWAVRRAERAGLPLTYTRGLGSALPFRDETFDAVVCCLVIEHVPSAEAVFDEIRRVLRPGGRLVLLINHPLYQGAGSGFIDDQILGERYWRVGPYLSRSVGLEQVDPGVEIAFAHRPLSMYLNPLVERGLYLTHLDEPPPRDEFLEGSIDPALEGAIPRLCVIRVEKILGPGGQRCAMPEPEREGDETMSGRE